ILSHTTGYKRIGWNSKIEAGWSRAKMLGELSKSPRTEPGKVFDYHNLAYSQIEDFVQSSTKIPFKASMQKYLFDPLKMTRTTVGFSEFSQQENKAWPHEKTRHWFRSKKKYSQNYHNTVMSAGGINSDIRDMARFLQLQLGAFPEIATEKDLEPFWEPATRAPDAKGWFRHIKYKNLQSSYGYGWRIADIDGERIVFHGGWVGGFINFMAFSPKRQIGIVILNNTETSFGFKTALKFLGYLDYGR
ncbi:MAG: serine hydrolase domain-containing protein, partial [Myxococcaceae bacterium]